MSVWHHYEITCLAKDRQAVAKFFNFDEPMNDIRGYGDRFELSFGGNYGPSLNYGKIVKQHPNLIFLVQESVECDTKIWWVDRFDEVSGTVQHIYIYTTGMVETKINKRLLEEYTEWCPSLPAKHFAREEGFEQFRWTSFLNDFDKVADKLKRADQYKEMIDCAGGCEYNSYDTSPSLEFDNQEPL